MTCQKTGYCLTNYHENCPGERWTWDDLIPCGCDCHQDADK